MSPQVLDQIQGFVGAASLAGLFFGLKWIASRRMRRDRDNHVDDRPDDYVDRLKVTRHWLTDEGVVRALVGTKTATRPGLQDTLDNLEAYKPEDLKILMGLLLQNREVRQVIATSMLRKEPDGDREALMALLLKWALPTKAVLESMPS